MKDWNSITIDRYYEDLKIDNRVGIGILNINRDINNTWLQKRCFDMTYFYINRMIKMGMCSYVGFHKTVEEILEQSLQKNKDFAMIACQGLLLFRGPSLITQSLNYYDNNKDFFTIGHIMDKEAQTGMQGSYPGLHRQYLFVNLQKWVELGKPKFDEMGVFRDRKPLLQNYKLSEDTVHSHYTPKWIGPADNAQEKHVEITADGSNWIDIAIRAGIKIDNLTNDMRDCKVFLYPYENTQQLANAWLNKDQDDGLNQSQAAWIRKLGYQEFIEKDRVYAFNTETLSGEGVRTDGKLIDHLFSAAAGFKPLAILNTNGFHKDTTVNYFDWCEASLNYKKHLLETWDGYDLDTWLLEHDLKYNFSSTYRGNYKKFWEQEVKEHGGREAFKELWDRYRQLKHTFNVVDLVTQPNQLFELINTAQGTKVLWTTNIWSSEMLQWNVEPEQLEQLWFKFEEMIPEDLVLYGHDYVAMDMRERLRNGKRTTHPRFENN
tara:strand:+ start:3096 stop:4565 length:1470 start_codon:yes stop_codon:yes gene_type:complete